MVTRSLSLAVQSRANIGALLNPKEYTDYLARVIADGGVVANNSATKSYIQFLKTTGNYSKTKIGWIGENGNKTRIANNNRVYIAKVYSFDGNGNDLIQATDANQPYSANNYNTAKFGINNPSLKFGYMTHPAITYTSIQPWTLCIVINNDGNASSSMICGRSATAANHIYIPATGRRFGVLNSSSIASLGTINSITKFSAEDVVFHFVAAGNGSVKVYENGVLIDTISVNTDFLFDSIFQYTAQANIYAGRFYGYRIQDGILSDSDIVRESSFLKSVYIDIETVNINDINISDRNASMLALTNGTQIPNGDLTATWTGGTALWCGHPASVLSFGKLYNKAARDAIKVSLPIGYHIATESELLQLSLNGGNALKSENPGAWATGGITNTNITKVSCVGGASRNSDGSFGNVLFYSSIWCADSDKVLKVYYDSNVAEIVSTTANEGHSIRFVKDSPGFNMLAIVPPTVAGDNNNHAILADIGVDDTMYFFGVSDKHGRIYKSINKGVTLTQIVDLKTTFSFTTRPSVWGCRILPNGEILVIANVSILVDGVTEHHTKGFISSANQSTWNYISKDVGGDFEMSYYNEKTGSTITFEVYGRIIDGWGFDTFNNYVLMTEYGYGTGTSAFPYKNIVGHMITGKVWLSSDYGVTFKQVFDYQNPPINITRITVPHMHHSHGCFIDSYTITDGKPRIIAMMGDTEARMVVSDDGGLTWFDNRANMNGYSNSVCGIATEAGYLSGTDAVVKNGIQLAVRGDGIFTCTEKYSVMRSWEPVPSHIVYVGGSFHRRGDMILSIFTPEDVAWYNQGARGGVFRSNDNGDTWTRIWTDNLGLLKNITGAKVMTTSDNLIWIRPAIWVQDINDGLGLMGRLIKLTN